MTNVAKLTAAFLISVVLVSFNGCARKQGPWEKAGSRTDEIIDNAQDGDPLLHKRGTAEKAGEAVDDAVDSIRGRR